MKTFLEAVAADMLRKFNTDMGHVAVVFPNKRAALFLNQAIARLSDKPLWSPAYITISDLFRQHSTLTVADQITAIAILHDSYNAVTGNDEDLDKFFSWGQLLLADFDDLDKNMGDASMIFRNLGDLHELDDFSYLNDEQVRLIRRFFSNFSADKSQLEERFLNLWTRLPDVYADFKRRLLSHGLAYEGMLYREVVEHGETPYIFDKYLFVGFNVLQKVEQRLFADLKSKGKALFYWDYDVYYTKGNTNEAGFYIRQWLDKFPNELANYDERIYDNMLKPKDIRLIASPTETLQARYVSTWLKENDRYKDGTRTAIVMCDENILQTVIHCIPTEVEKLNVTTGFPLKQTPVASFVTQLISLQTKGWDERRHAFRLHYINAVLRHPYAKYVSKLSQGLFSELNTDKRFYVTPNELAKDEGLAELFNREGIAVDTSCRADGYDLGMVLRWLMNVVKRIAVSGNDSASPLFQESVFRIYKLLNNFATLISTDTEGRTIADSINIYTFQHLVGQIIASTTVPFHGEPAEGVQVMGVLETRNLDFDHILILSCNEGNMPKGVDDTSFIPHALRKAYGLTTVDNKVAVYSYYFHSMIQRAGDVTIVYNSSTDGMNSGEMSRFVLQLMVEMPQNQRIMRYSLQAGQIPLPTVPEVVGKPAAVMEKLDGIPMLSPTAINTYMRCGMQFFYKYVANIKETDEQDEDEIDNRVFGNIFHRAAELLYSTPKRKIDEILNIAFNEELFHQPELTATEPQLNGMQLINRTVIKRYLAMLQELDGKLGRFEVIAHEAPVSMEISLGKRKVKVGGRIDRIDRVNIGEPTERLRVVDYKTGTREASDIKGMDDVFDRANITRKHSDYILQAMLYSVIEQYDDAEHNPNRLNVSPALLFIQHTKSKDYDPTLTVNKQPITDVGVYRDDFMRLLKERLSELYNPDVPFGLTDDENVCRVCPYRLMCGK